MSVGARMFGSSAAMSTRYLAAIAARHGSSRCDVDVRWSSSIHAICSSVASGMNVVVNNRRNTGSADGPNRRESSARNACSASSGSSSSVAAAGDGAVQHEAGHPLGVCVGIGDGVRCAPEMPMSANRSGRAHRRPPRDRETTHRQRTRGYPNPKVRCRARRSEGMVLRELFCPVTPYRASQL